MSEKFNKALYIALSLLIAIAFWIFVDSEQDGTITADFKGIPIEFLGETDTLPSRGLMLTEGADTTVDLKVRGKRLVVTNLKKEDIRLQVDLTGVNGVGPYTLNYEPLFPDNIKRGDVTIEQASRSAVTVKVSELFSRTVPVQAEVVGEMAEGYIYQSQLLRMEPSSIIISGREEDVIGVDAARVVIDLEGADSTVHKNYSYELLDSEGNAVEPEGLRFSDKQVEVTAPVYLVKTLALTVKLKETPGSVQEYVEVTQEHNSIEVAWEAANLENWDDIVLGEVDLSLYPSDTELELDVNLPEGCVNVSGVKSTTVTLNFSDSVETRAFHVTDISAIGLGEGQSFRRMTNAVDVLVRGPAEELDKLTDENVRIVVDMTQYADNGTYTVPAKVLVDGGGKVGAVGTYVVSCKITS